MVHRSESNKLPKDNPFFNLTPELRAKAEANLQKKLESEIKVISLPGQGEASYVTSCLNSVQEILKTYQEYGYQVALLDEEQFPALAEAIGPLKRASLTEEIQRIMIDVLRPCFMPVPEPKRPSMFQRVIASMSG